MPKYIIALLVLLLAACGDGTDLSFLSSSDSVEEEDTGGLSDDYGLSASPELAQVSLTWNEDPEATSYDLFRYQDSNCAAIPDDYTACDNASYKSLSAASTIDTGLSANSIYYYRVRSVGAEQNGDLSNQLEVLTLPAAPSSLAAAVDDGRVTLSWGEQSGIDQYQLYRYSNPDCDTVATNIAACVDDESWSIIGGDTSQQDTGLDGGETYYYQVISVNASGASDLSPQLTFIAPPENVGGFGIVSSSDAVGGISLIWSDAAGASYYEIYRDSASRCEGIPDDLSLCPDAVQFAAEESEYLDTSAQEGFSYFYSVRAVNSSGASALTTQRSASMPLELFPPVLSSAVAQGLTIDLNWSAADKALSYQVYISTEANCSDFPDSPTECPGFTWLSPSTNSNITEATSVSFGDLAEGTTYYFSVLAATGETVSDLSSELNATTVPSAPDSASFQAIAVDGAVDLSWSASAGAATYSLYWHNDSSCLDSVVSVADIAANCSSYSEVIDIVGESYIHSELNASTSYHYYLLANNAAGASALTTVVSILTAPAAVQNLVAESTTEAISLSWSSDQANLERFELYRYQDSGCTTATEFACGEQSSWLDISPDATSFIDDTAVAGEVYYYQVAAVNDTAKTSSAEVLSALRLSPADNISVAASEGLLTVSWSAVTGVEHYVLYRYSGDCPELPATATTCSNYQEYLLDANQTTYADSAVGADEFYSYQVAARITGARDSELSAIVTGNPLLPSPELALTPVGGGVRIEFPSVLGAESYNIYRYTDAGCLLSEATVSASCLDYELLSFAADSSDLINPDNSAAALYDDLGLSGGHTYYYRASSANAIDSSELSPEISSLAHLAQPAMVGGSTGYGSSVVEWGAVLGAEAYTIYQYLADGSNCYPQSATAATTCTAGYAEHNITADANNSSTGHSYSQGFTDLDGALDYGYVALASNSIVPDSALSEPLLLHIGLPAPEGLSATASASAVTLNWDPVTNAGGYSVFRSSAANCLSVDSDNASCPEYAALPTGLDLSIVDTGLDGGTTYYYRVTALENGSTTGAYSEEVNATPTLLTPQNLQALAGSGAVELIWEPVLGAEGYTIYRYTQQPCSFILERGDDCGELYIESNNSAHGHISTSLVGDETYYFRVAATHAGLSDSNLSDEAEATPAVGIPAPVVSVIENNLTVSWDAVAGTSGYNLHRSTGASCFADVELGDYLSNSSLCPDYQFWQDLNSTAVAENNLSLDSTYYYAVQSVVAGIAIDILSEVVSGVPLAQPQWLDLAGGVEAVTVTWDNSSSGAESYTIYRSSVAACSEALADWQQCPDGRIFSGQSGGVFVDQDSLAPGHTYHYRLQAVNYSGSALNPTELNATTAPDVPTDINVSFSELGVTVEWDTNQLGVSQFDLYRYTVAQCGYIPDAYQQCGADSARWLAASSPFLDSVDDLEPGTVYYYTLIASNAAGSNASAEQQVLTGSAAPDIGSIVGGFGSIEVSWGSVFGADSYNLYRYAQADCSDTDIVGLSSDCAAYKFEDVSSPFTDPPSADAELQLASSTYYHYRLTSINSAGSSALSDIGSGLTKPDAPEIVLASGGDKSAYLEYVSTNANLNNYIFTRDTVSGCNLDIGFEVCPFMVELDGDLDTNYTDSDLNPGTTYYYHAYTVNNSGRSLASNEVNITTIPNPPLNLAAAAASTTEIVITWDRQVGAESYALYRYTDPSCSVEQLEANISACGSEPSPSQLIADIPDDTATPQYHDYGLNPNAYYYYRIRAQNSGGISDFSDEVFSLTSPSQPEDLAGIGGDAEVNLSWTPVANALYYYLYKYTDAGCTTYADDIASCSDGSQQQISPASPDAAVSSYQDTQVSNSTYYYYRIQAINASGASAISDELEVLTYPADPQTITSNVTSSKISLTWSIENSVTSYDLYRYSNADCSSLHADYLNCDDAVRYQLVNTGSDSDFQSKTDDDNLEIGTVYYYRIVSYNASGSKTADELAVATAPATPENFYISPILGLEPSLELSWSGDTTGVADFTLYRYQPAGCLLDDGDTSACADGFPITFNGITAQSFKDGTGLSAGTEYSYRVAATSSHSGQAQSALSAEESAFTFPAPPLISNLAAATNSMTISFDTNQSGADSYTLHRYSGLPGCVSILGTVTNCNDYQLYANQTLSPIIDDNLDSGTLYYYRIASNGAAGTGIYSDEYSASTLPGAPANIDLAVSLDGIVASWDSDQQGAESFILYRSRTPDCLILASDGSLCTDYLEVDSLTSGEYNDTGLAYGYAYYYQLRAVNASGISALSAEFSAYTLPPAPSIDSLVGGANQVEINYSKDNISGIVSYNLYRYSNQGCAEVPGNLFVNCDDGQRWSSTSAIDNSIETITDDDLEDGKTYYYRLSAVNVSGEGPASEEYAAVTVPSAPTIEQVIGGDRKIELEFTDDMPTATSYLVYRYSAFGCYDSEAAPDCDANEWGTFSVSTSPVTDPNLDPGSKFYYSMVAVNSSGSSAFSNQVSGITIPAESAILSVAGGDGYLEISFDDSIAGADTYHVYGYTGNNCIQKLSDYDSRQDACAAVVIDSPSSPASESGLGDGVTRYYRVASVNDSGSSDLSSQASGITLPPAAESISFTGSDSSITLSWDDNQNGVSSYTAYQYTSSNCANFNAEEGDILASCASLQGQSNADSPVTFSNLDPGTTYYHLIKSSNATGYKFTSELSATTVPPAPPAPSLTGGAGTVVVNFDSSLVTGAEYFQIYRSTTSACVRNTAQSICADLVVLPSDANQTLTAADFPYTDANLSAGTAYYYHLSAHNALGASPYSGESVTTTAPEAPTAINLTPGRNSITIDWTTSSGATQTNLYRYSDSGCAGVPNAISACQDPSFVELNATTSTYTDTGLEHGAVYYYTLQAVNASGSALSEESGALTHPAPTSITTISGGDLNVSIEFDDSLADAVDNYLIYRYNDTVPDCLVEKTDYSLDTSTCVGFQSLPTVLEPTLLASPYTDTYALSPGATYYYQIQSFNSSGSSALSPAVSAITIPAAPLQSAISTSSSVDANGTNVVTITWDNDILGNTNGSTLYRYTDQGCSSIYGASPDASQCGDYAVWTPLSDTSSSFTITDSGLDPSTEYYYVIQVSNASGSAYSEEVSAITYPAAIADPIVTGGTQAITVEWDNTVATITSYTLHFTSDGSCSAYDDASCADYFSKVFTPDIDSFTISNLGDASALGDGTTYYVTMVAANATGSSVSNTVSAITLPAAPVFSSIDYLSSQDSFSATDSMSLAWTHSGEGLEYYNLVRYQDPDCMSDEGDYSACAIDELYVYESDQSIDASATSFTDSEDLEAATRYYYRLGASNASGSAWSAVGEQVSAPEVIDPTIVTSDDSITVSWAIPADQEISSVNVYSTSQFGCSTVPATATNQCTDWQEWNNTDPSLGSITYYPSDTGKVYYLYLHVFNASGAALSGAVDGVLLASPPEFETIAGGDQSIDLSWENISSATKYTLYLYGQSCTDTAMATSACVGVEASDQSTNFTTISTYQGSPLAVGTEYFFRVSVTNAQGESALSDENSSYTIASVPTNISLTPSGNQITVSWDPSVGATANYNVYRYSSSCSASSVSVAELMNQCSATRIDGRTSPYVNTGLAAGTTYYYRVTAVNSSGESAPSAEVSAEPLLGAPANLVATTTNSGIELTWATINGATGHEIYRYTTASCMTARADMSGCTSYDTFTLNYTNANYTDSTAVGGTTYYYRVAALQSAISAGELSNEASATASLLAPEVYYAQPGYGEIELSWKAADGATSYDIYRYTTAGCLSDADLTCADAILSASGSATAYTDSGLDGLVTYYYRLAAISSASNSLLSDELSATTLLPAPTNLSASSSELSISLSWDAVTSSAIDPSHVSYTVYRYTNSDNSCTAPQDTVSALLCNELVSSSASSNSYTDNSFAAGGSTYKYRVQSLHSDGSASNIGDISAEVSAQPILATPKNLDLEAASASLSLSWDTVAGADAYLVHSHSDAACGTSTSNITSCTGYNSSSVSATSFALANLDSDTTYYLTLQATRVGADSPSAYSAVESAQPYLAAITGFQAYGSDAEEITTEWAAVADAISYTVYFHQDAGCTYTGYADTTDQTVSCAGVSSHITDTLSMVFDKSINGITDGDTYYFQVRASNASGNVSPYSDRLSVLAFSEPSITTIAGADQEINLTFNDMGGSHELYVYRYTDGDCDEGDMKNNVNQCDADGGGDDTKSWPFYPGGSALSDADKAINDSGLQEGKRYYYKVWSTPNASNIVGVFSERASAMTMPPAPNKDLGFNPVGTLGTQISLTFTLPAGEDNHYQLLRHTDADCANLTDADFNRSDYTDLSGVTNSTGDPCTGLVELEDPANFPASTGVNTETYLDSGLQTSTTYYYLYRSVNYSGAKGVDPEYLSPGVLSGTSVISNQVQWSTIPRASADGDLTIDAAGGTSTSVLYSFAEIPTATSYSVHLYLASCAEPDITACASHVESNHTSSDVGATFTFTGLTVGTEYDYILQAHNAAGSTDLTQSYIAAGVPTLPTDPTITAVTGGLDDDTNEFVISWSADTVDFRRIYGSTDDSCLSTVINGGINAANTAIASCDNHIYLGSVTRDNDMPINAHSGDSSPLKSGSTYYFTISNHNATGASAFAPIDSNITVPAAPNDISLAAAYREIEVSWVPPLGSDSNVLYRYNNARCDKPVTELATCGSDTAAYTFTTADLGFTPDGSNSYTYLDTNNATGLLDAEEYRYVVQAINVSGYRLTEDNSIDANHTAPATPTSLSAIATDNSIALSWDGMSEATQYQILRSTDDQCYSDITGLGAYAPSACSNSEATTFDIAHSDVDTTQTYTDTALSYGTIYHYWIRSYSTSGYSASTINPETNTTAPPRAAQVTLTATRGSTNQTNIEINWVDAAQATSYALYRSTKDACIADNDGNLKTNYDSCTGYNRDLHTSLNSLSITHTNLGNDTIYYYYVAGINAAGEGRLSPVNSVRTAATAPALSLDNQGTATEIEVTWPAASAYDSEYQLYLYTGSSSCDPSAADCVDEISFTANQSPYTVTGLTAGTEYHAKIVATTEYTQADGKTSTLTGDVSSSAQSKHTRPYHPTITSYSITNSNANYFELTLSDNGSGTDDITYTLYRTESSDCTRTSAIASICSNAKELNSNTSPIEDNDTKEDSTHYYYYAWSTNPGGDSIEPANYDTSAFEAISSPENSAFTDFVYSQDDSTIDEIAITVSSNNSIPANDTWRLIHYPTLITDSLTLTHTIAALDDANEYSVKLPVSDSHSRDESYLFQKHTVILETTNNSGVVFEMDKQTSIQLPPPLIRYTTSLTSDTQDLTKQMKYELDINNAYLNTQYLADTYDLELEVNFYITRRSSCFTYGELVQSTTCTTVSNMKDILNATSNDALYYVNDINGGLAFDNSFDAFVHTQSYADLADGSTNEYRYFAAITGYTINPSGQYAFFGADKLVMGDDASFKIQNANTNSIQAPSPSLVATPALLAQQLAATGADPNSWDLTLLWSALSGISAYDIYEYSNPDCAYLLSEPSLCANFNLYSSNIPEFTRAFSGADSGNYFYYRLQAHDSAGNSSALGEQITAYVPQPLNDSGLSSCLESELISGRQDCQVGRDAELEASAKVGSGSAGFDFNASTDESGSLCVQDNVTGLSWLAWSPDSGSGSDSTLTGLDTNTSTVSFASIAAISLEACGHSDWRLPSLHELLSIADYNQSAAKLDTSIFAEFNSSLPTYWSASGHVLDFSSGEFGFESSASARHSVFLTRGARSWGSDFGAERFQLVEELDDNNLSIYLVFDMHSQLRYAPCLAGMSYDPLTHSCSGAATALDYIDSLNAYDANSSWRQPNIKELVAILDPSNSLQPNPEFFPAYPAGAQIFSLTPSTQSAAAITGRLFDVETQSSQPAIFELLNSHLIYAN